jgi:WD40 repeat protein
MATFRAPSTPLLVLLVCAPQDLPAMRAIGQRLRADEFEAAVTAELLSAAGGSPRALREALGKAGAVVICLSRRSWDDGALAPAIGSMLDLLRLVPAPGRLLLGLRLARTELPPALDGAPVIDLFSASGYERLQTTLREHAARVMPRPPPPEPEPSPPPTIPALKLRGGFGLPDLDRQGLVRRLGRGVARALFLIDNAHALLVSGGGPALIPLAGGAAHWAIDCPARRAALSPSGRLLALAAGAQITLWDLAEGQLLGVCAGHTDTVSGLAFAPDERTMASSSHDRSIRLWRIGDAQPPTPLATLTEHPDHATSVAFSPDGSLIAAGGADRSVRIWRSLDRTRVQTLGGQRGAVAALAFSPDGATLAAGSRGRSVSLWDTRSWRLQRSLDGHEGAVESLVFSPDGATLATGASDQTARLWRVDDGSLARELHGHSGPVVGVAFSRDGATLATIAEDGRLIAWEPATGAERSSTRPLSGRVGGMALSSGGTLLAVGASDGSLAVHSIEAETAHRKRFRDQDGAIESLAFASAAHLIGAATDRTVRTYDLERGTSSLLLQTHGALQGAALAPNGRLLASFDGESTVQLWRLAAPNETPEAQFWRVLRGLRGRPRRVLFAPEAEAIAVATEDGGIGIWSLAGKADEQAEPEQQLMLQGGLARSLAWSGDGALLAAGSDDGTVLIWHTGTGAVAAALKAQGRGVTSLAFSADRRLLAAGDAGGTVLQWRLTLDNSRRRQPRAATIAGHAGSVEQLTFAPGGLLISGSSDGTVRLWRIS